MDNANLGYINKEFMVQEGEYSMTNDLEKIGSSFSTLKSITGDMWN